MSEDTWGEIREAHDKAKWASLLELCALHRKRAPDHLEARIPQAIALRHLNRFEDAAALLQGTHDHETASQKCKYHCQCELGLTFEQMGKLDHARNAYQAAHYLIPTKTVPIIYRGAMELRLGDFAAARDWLCRALDCPDGDFDEAHFNIGSTYLSEQNYLKAIEHYQKAIAIDPDYDLAWEFLADAKRGLEIHQQSEGISRCV
jgi:tetratricopeptide (TPR) repeat protein